MVEKKKRRRKDGEVEKGGGGKGGCGGSMVNLVKEVKKDRDGIRKDIKKVQKEKSQLPLNGSLPLSGTQELTLDPLRGENAVEGKNQLTHLPLSSSLPLSGTLLGLGPLFYNFTNSI
ncbi:hypothetical protein LR48_Vigan148s001200 [Vigna angularis]|uniref:Uncharacterized protein n=1 Tax=Phaseolus angularis TaxID=3914 RepID=A0A0L9T4Z5_PHAAN|nr:hypothetical protein LR48_Vigan148s001200 [Vigna angularis]